MNLAERGLLRDGSSFNKNRSKRSDQMPADNGCLERTTERVSIRAFSCFGRLVLPILVVTILVYCWLAVKAPENVERRNIIRSSYGNEKDWEAFANHNLTVLTVFLLGRTNNATLQMDIDKESDLHDDIVQEDFVDCYDNLTMKTVMALKWMTNHCRHATFVIKFVDTAVIIQTKLYQRWLYTALIDVPKTTWAAGQVRMDAKVFRNTDDKFFISKDFYAFPTYPPYLDGQGYVLSTDLVEAIYNVAITTPLFPWEDIFIGMCLQKLHVVPTNIENFV
eukprot:XP_011670228.1 PREDICTED: beta-1,3-galactosyltransferase 5-like [Strongylocentrotus purpuratus]